MPKIPRTSLYAGFTMVELILVMSIIAILATAFTLNYTGSQKRARDTERRNDLKQYQIALEKYANSNSGFYPLRDPAVLPSSLCVSPLNVLNCTKDPKIGETTCSGGAECKYQYLSICPSCSAGSDATQYALWATLENPHDSSKSIYVVCSSGVSGESGSAPTTATICPL
jgi:prepilin-type N-terminal cleavage/methylation domain-containing protein